MKDHHKMRAWDGGKYLDPSKNCGLTWFWGTVQDRQLEIEQCTGLKDKNGKLIYEGDLIINDGFEYKTPTVVGFDDGSFILIDEGGKKFCNLFNGAYNVARDSEIIGNTHENPELLGGNA